MQLKTILNRVADYKSFVFEKVTWLDDSEAPAVDVEIVPRKNGVRVCSGCDRVRPGYDTMPDRTAKTLLRFFRFLGPERSAALQFVCSDMWQAHLKEPEGRRGSNQRQWPQVLRVTV